MKPRALLLAGLLAAALPLACGCSSPRESLLPKTRPSTAWAWHLLFSREKCGCHAQTCLGVLGGRLSATATKEGGHSVPATLMWLYKNYLAQVDGMRSCRFYPTCGDYAREAIRKHGPLVGWVMACERAIRYHGEREAYPRAFVEGTRLVDGVSDNDFWFHHPFRRKQP